MEQRLSGWTLFTLKGVAVRLHVSLLFLLFYVILVAMVQFSAVTEASGVSPDQLSGSPFGWAVVFALSLLVSIFVHEYGHVLVALAHGYKVRGITLMMLGGVSQIENMTEKPAAEFKIAIIGPLVSLAIGGILFWIRSLSESANVDFYCYWIGQTNIALGIFNLLPAFPTDGGRVLRAFLASRQGYLKGTATAVRVSTAFAWFFGIFGLFQLNFLLMLIAFFIYTAAKSELFILIGKNILRGMKVKDLMVSTPTISERFTLSDAAHLMLESKNTLLPVIGENDSYGVVSDKLIQHIPKESWSTTPVRDVQITIPKIITAEDSLDEVFLLVLGTTAGGVPVIENGTATGVLRERDLFDTIRLLQLTEKPNEKIWPFKPKQQPT